MRAGAAGLPEPETACFERDFDLIGVQRHLKVLGIFARLRHRDGKLRYLADAPRFLGYLDDVLPRHRQLDTLRTIIDRHVRPALADIGRAACRERVCQYVYRTGVADYLKKKNRYELIANITI